MYVHTSYPGFVGLSLFFLWGRGVMHLHCVYVTLIYLWLEPGNLLKQATDEKRLPVLLPE